MSEHDDFLDKQVAKFSGTPMEWGYRYVHAQTHEARLKAVQKSVDSACNKLVKHRNKKQNDDEDSLSIQVCDMLNSSGIKATHNTAVGGHCDIVVEGDDDFLWLAEAKKHNAYSWLDKGFQQLTSRYSTGNEGQDNGEVLIYCFVKDALKMLEKWQSELVSRNQDVTVEKVVDGSKLVFHSQQKHECSGSPFFVRHKAVSLYWNPKD